MDPVSGDGSVELIEDPDALLKVLGSVRLPEKGHDFFHIFPNQYLPAWISQKCCRMEGGHYSDATAL